MDGLTTDDLEPHLDVLSHAPTMDQDQVKEIGVAAMTGKNPTSFSRIDSQATTDSDNHFFFGVANSIEKHHGVQGPFFYPVPTMVLMLLGLRHKHHNKLERRR